MPSIAETLETALQHHKQGELDIAERLYGEIIEENPDHAEALHLLGVMAYQRGDPERAIRLFDQAIAADDTVAKYYGNLGAAYAAFGRYRDALSALETAARLDPESAEILNSLGAVQRPLGQLDAAIASFARAAELEPGYAQPHANAAVALLQTGQRDEALQSAWRAVELDPNDPDCRNNLALVLRAKARREEALAELERAVELDPRHAEAVRNLGVLLLELRRPAAALRWFERLSELRPDDGLGEINQAQALRLQGRIDEATTLCRRAVELRPENSAYRSIALDLLTGSPAATAERLFEEHRDWHDLFAAPLAEWAAAPAAARDTERKLRIGYVLSALPERAPLAALVAVLAAHDRGTTETVLFLATSPQDEAALPLLSACDAVHDISLVGDERLASLIRGEKIDVLVDLAGHRLRNRLLVFARRPAPVQVSWSTYAATTGLSEIDHLIGDAVAIPDGDELWFAEAVHRLPHAFLCFAPPEDAPPIEGGPADGGAVTFGVFVESETIAGPAIETWASIVADMPDARLRIAAPVLGEAETADVFRAAFAAHGLDPARLDLSAETGPEAYRGVDVALDSFPRSDPWAVLEALWMGVPVVTLKGDRMAGRLGATVLDAVGLSHLVTETTIEYRALARSLGGEAERLGALRASFRDRLANSALCDVTGFARDLEEAYRTMWRRWCAQAA